MPRVAHEGGSRWRYPRRVNKRRAGRSEPGRPPYRAAAICTPGLEFVCRQELADLGCKPKPAGPGTVEFDANARQLYAANTWLRTASRVVVRVGTFRSTDFAHLQDRASEIDWSAWLADGVAPRFRISSNESKLYHTKAIAQRLHQVVGPASTGGPEQLFVIRIDRNTVTVSVDASGEALHHRAWRTDLGDAPLRTTMAAALLLATQWSASSTLIDPFCGAGTIAIEGALLARNLPPGGDRTFAFAQWPHFEPGAWASVAGTVAANATTTLNSAGVILASDRDDEAVAAAKANAERAGVSDDIEFETKVVSHIGARTDEGLVATNPPYGKRIGDGDLTGLYRRLGGVVRERLPGFGLAMISSDRKLASKTDRALAPLARFRHGGLPVQLLYRPSSQPDPGEAGPEEPAVERLVEKAVSESVRSDPQPDSRGEVPTPSPAPNQPPHPTTNRPSRAH